MIQLQYYRKGLTKMQIEQILNNYKLKYTTLTNEINSKLNYLIKTVINDICPFLENIEDISKEIKNLKEMDNHKKTIELLKSQLHEKSLIENQLQNDITYLKKEITSLKEKQLHANNSTDNVLKTNDKNDKNDIPSSPKRLTKIRKKSLDLKINTDNQALSSERSSRKKNKSEQNSSKNVTQSIHSKSTMNKNQNPKNKIRNSYLMNMQEITRSVNDNHNQVKSTRNIKNVNKFICFSNKKNMNKDLKNKKVKTKKTKSMDLSLTVDSITKNRKMEINNINEAKNNYLANKNKNYDYDYDGDIIEEDIDDEIKELEIDEQCILKLIDNIKNLGNKKEVE